MFGNQQCTKAHLSTNWDPRFNTVLLWLNGSFLSEPGDGLSVGLEILRNSWGPLWEKTKYDFENLKWLYECISLEGALKQFSLGKIYLCPLSKSHYVPLFSPVTENFLGYANWSFSGHIGKVHAWPVSGTWRLQGLEEPFGEWCWKEGMVFVNMPVSYVKYFLSSKLTKYIYWSVENGFLYFAC